MNIGTKIKKIRYSNNISQADMAKLLEINRNYLSRIETNKSVPSAEILTKLANNFNVSIDALLRENDENNNDSKIKLINKELIKLDSSKLDFIINMINYMSNKKKN